MLEKRKILIFGILAIMVISMAGVGFYYWYQNTYYVSTEDARVAAEIVRATPQITGKLIQFDVQEGQIVQKGQIIGRQEMVSSPNSNLELAIIRAPISGTVLKKQGNVDEVVSPGQPLVMLANMNELYVTANIEETKLGRVKPGGIVEITIDEYPDRSFSGRVESIGQATAATFSLLPAATGGNFTKVVQKVPVKISLSKTGVGLLPGTSAIIKIHVK